MTPAELNDAIRTLGLSAEGFARAIGVSGRAVRRWQAGDRDIPPMLVTLIELLLDNPMQPRKWFFQRAAIRP